MAVNFRKRLEERGPEKKVDPIEIYKTLDTKVGIVDLRPAQLDVLQNWFANYREKKDTILKLHTGQGKTLVGLLMLQSRLNEGKGPALYLCPDKYLVHQTQKQAERFGIKYCLLNSSGVFPSEFLEGKQILITHAQRFFNGRSVFKVGANPVDVGAIVLDDSHSCIDHIRESFTIKINRRDEEKLYDALVTLFEADLKEQGQSRFGSIAEKDHKTVMLVPYWAWQDKEELAGALLREYGSSNAIKFAWPLLSSELRDCQCYISGTSIEISPYHNNIDLFGSLARARTRIFMSATTSNDAFFIKELGLSREVVQNPLVYSSETWSGEKLILDPYRISDILHRGTIIDLYGAPKASRRYGVVSLVHSGRSAKHWEEKGAQVISRQQYTDEELQEEIAKLRTGDCTNTRVLVNRYDGVDLPDESCRILILDSLPFAQSLADGYQEYCRPTSNTIEIRMAQRIEQGLGRGVRGEKDYCVILITGPDLINVLRTPRLRRNFSPQTQKQIEIGLEVTKMVSEDAETGDPVAQLDGVMKQCLLRDEDWKNFYQQEMNSLSAQPEDAPIYHIMELEREAALAYRRGDLNKAQQAIQNIITNHLAGDEEEKGWYMQEMARYAYAEQRVAAEQHQATAYRNNQALLKPKGGAYFKKLVTVQSQVEKATEWLKDFSSFELCQIAANSIFNDLEFGRESDKFETALKNLGLLLGFGSEQPDKRWKQGPDNLWNVAAGDYIFFECKNATKPTRIYIYKGDAGQIGQHHLWFKEQYHDAAVIPVIVSRTRNLYSDARFEPETRVMDKSKLAKLVASVRAYLKEFKTYSLKDVSTDFVSEALRKHALTGNDIKTRYLEIPLSFVAPVAKQ